MPRVLAGRVARTLDLDGSTSRAGVLSHLVTGGSVGLSLHNHGGDNQGAILDNVGVSAVPEPASVALMLAGLGFVGFAARCRQVR